MPEQNEETKEEPKPLTGEQILCRVEGMGEPAAKRLSKKMSDAQSSRIRECFEAQGKVRDEIRKVRTELADAGKKEAEEPGEDDPADGVMEPEPFFREELAEADAPQ